ncbi:hypothetical protein C0991_006999 [Blastosporella zonata]|nr:hypothetical protein C0991_006999 [Blastosporella zonata]
MSTSPVNEPSPSTDSQNDSTEVEMGDVQRSGIPQFTQYTSPPTKKKRTRTLTTPHQAAVLHALLAKSRFPNTAVREEVGRSIGLTARKVQIWFQNQRQKARRPRSQSDAASQRPSPQFGAFPSGSDGPVLGSFPSVPEQSSSSRTHLERSTSHSSDYFSDIGVSTSRGCSSPEPHPEAMESSAQLLGPGMPGSEMSPELPPYRRLQSLSLRPTTAYETSTRYIDTRHQSFRPPTPPRLHLPLAISRPTSTTRSHDRNFSRTLPPLVFHTAPSRSSSSAPGPSSGPFFPEYRDRRSLSPEAMFAHQPPQPTSNPLFPPSPPYVIQPRPQWDAPSFGSVLRSSQLPRALHGHRSPGASVTPPGSAAENAPTITADRTEYPTTSIETRPSGRYDPVRAMFISPPSPEDEH